MSDHATSPSRSRIHPLWPLRPLRLSALMVAKSVVIMACMVMMAIPATSCATGDKGQSATEDAVAAGANDLRPQRIVTLHPSIETFFREAVDRYDQASTTPLWLEFLDGDDVVLQEPMRADRANAPFFTVPSEVSHSSTSALTWRLCRRHEASGRFDIVLQGYLVSDTSGGVHHDVLRCRMSRVRFDVKQDQPLSDNIHIEFSVESLGIAPKGASNRHFSARGTTASSDDDGFHTELPEGQYVLTRASVSSPFHVTSDSSSLANRLLEELQLKGKSTTPALRSFESHRDWAHWVPRLGDYPMIAQVETEDPWMIANVRPAEEMHEFTFICSESVPVIIPFEATVEPLWRPMGGSSAHLHIVTQLYQKAPWDLGLFHFLDNRDNRFVSNEHHPITDLPENTHRAFDPDAMTDSTILVPTPQAVYPASIDETNAACGFLVKCGTTDEGRSTPAALYASSLASASHAVTVSSGKTDNLVAIWEAAPKSLERVFDAPQWRVYPASKSATTVKCVTSKDADKVWAVVLHCAAYLPQRRFALPSSSDSSDSSDTKPDNRNDDQTEQPIQYARIDWVMRVAVDHQDEGDGNHWTANVWLPEGVPLYVRAMGVVRARQPLQQATEDTNKRLQDAEPALGTKTYLEPLAAIIPITPGVEQIIDLK